MTTTQVQQIAFEQQNRFSSSPYDLTTSRRDRWTAIVLSCIIVLNCSVLSCSVLNCIVVLSCVVVGVYIGAVDGLVESD